MTEERDNIWYGMYEKLLDKHLQAVQLLAYARAIIRDEFEGYSKETFLREYKAYEDDFGNLTGGGEYHHHCKDCDYRWSTNK